MDNSTVRKRDLKEAKNCVNGKVKKIWPLLAVLLLTYVFIRCTFESIKRFILYWFKEKKSIKGKVVLITGAGRGVGRGLARGMAKLGAHIACVDINTVSNEETAKLIKSEGGIAEAFTCNVAKIEQIEQLKKDVLAKFRQVDILVNNAALIMPFSLKEMTPRDIKATYEVNCMGPAIMLTTFLNEMVERNSGHIVLVSSVAAFLSVPYLALYSSTKAGSSRFFESVRTELDATEGNNIKVTTIHPYFINTSADYISWFESHFPVLEEDQVVKCAIDAILYEKENLCIPEFLSGFKITDSLMGSYQYNFTLNIIGDGIKLPSQADRESLPYSSVVSESSKS